MKYGYTDRGVRIEPREGWVILPEGEPVPERYMVFIENMGHLCWIGERRTRSPITPLNAGLWGNVRAFAVPR